MKETRLLVILGVIIPILLVVGCEEKSVQPGETENTIDVHLGIDDASVSALSDLLPNNTFGFVITGFDRASVGVGLSGGGDSLTSRAIFRFNVSDINESVDLHLYCISKIGSPGNVEVYIVNDSGTLHDSEGPQPENVSNIWNLIDTGIKLTEIKPSENGWSEINIPFSTIVEKRGKDGYITIMVKLADENIDPANVYEFSTFEYAQSHGGNGPYLSYVSQT